MSEITAPSGRRLPKLDGAWLISAAICIGILLFAGDKTATLLSNAANSLIGTLPFIAFAVLAVAYLKATSGENVIAEAFKGSETRMIILAALVGGLSPFCSCEIIPFIAAMLALGVPLSAVMALWLSSPLMDPAMFSITAAALGWEFAIAKTIAAVSLGLFGGFGVRMLAPTGMFNDILRPRAQKKSCCGSSDPYSGKPVWAFWGDAERRETFRDEAIENGIFLLKWLILAYLLEALMIEYVPSSFVAQFVGGEGLQPILLGAIIGGPAYLNGYAAVPLVAGLLESGMAPGAAMAFVLAGGVSCIPAAIAVWALVKPRAFAAYIGFAFVGAIVAGVAWGAYV